MERQCAAARVELRQGMEGRRLATHELDLKTWGFEEESFVPMELLLNGKVYSIVTDQGGNCLLKKLATRGGM